MDTEKFKAAYNESRNGCNQFIRHPLARQFAYTDGVQACAEAGCYWLIDILATELPAEFRKQNNVPSTCVVTVAVAKHKAVIRAEFEDGVVAWSKKIDMTGMPDGDWQFYIADEGPDTDARYRCILLSEY